MDNIRKVVENHGYYVFLGGLGLLGFIRVPYSYTSIFIRELNPIAARLLGCFLIIQGCVRFNYTVHKHDRLVMTSFLVDALLFANEMLIMNNIEFYTGTVVIGTSLVLASSCYFFGDELD